MAQHTRYLDFSARTHPDICTTIIAHIGDRQYPDVPDQIAFLHQNCRQQAQDRGLDLAAVYKLGPASGIIDDPRPLDYQNHYGTGTQKPGMRVRITRGAGGSSSLRNRATQGGWAQSLTNWIEQSLSPDQAQEFSPLGRIIALDTVSLVQKRASENLIPAWRGAASPITRVNSDLYATAGDIVDAAMIAMLRLDLSPATTLAGCHLLSDILATQQGFEQAPGQPVPNLMAASELTPSNMIAAYLSGLPYGQTIQESAFDAGQFRIHDLDEVIGAKTATLSRVLRHCHDRGGLDLWQPAYHPAPAEEMAALYARPLALVGPMKAILGSMADNTIKVLADGLNIASAAGADIILVPVEQRYPAGQYGPPPSPISRNDLEPPAFSP